MYLFDKFTAVGMDPTDGIRKLIWKYNIIYYIIFPIELQIIFWLFCSLHEVLIIMLQQEQDQLRWKHSLAFLRATILTLKITKI